MGQPVKIVDLAERMIHLSGLEPGRDIEIVFTGTRPGERLNEILFAREEPVTETGIAGVVAARPLRPSLDTMRGWLDELARAVERDERDVIARILTGAVDDFRKEAV
jgi:O-antigen biosynthesis protein WbqV